MVIDSPAVPTRSWPSVLIATCQPSPSPPSRQSTGMRGVGEEHLVEHRVAGDVADRPALDAGRLHVDDERGDALVLRAALDRGRVGAQEEQAPLARGARTRSRSSGRSPRTRRRRGSPCVRMLARSEPASGSLKPWHQCSSAVRMPGQPALLLLVGAPLEDHRADLPDAVRVVDARRCAPAPSPRRRSRSARAWPRGRSSPAAS